MMMYLVAFSIVVLLFFLIQNKVRASFLFVSLVLVYYFLDLITLEKMLHGFVNPSLITLVLLLLISIVFEKASFITFISNKLFSPSYRYSLLKMSLLTSLFSAFLNNTAVVASMISVVNKNKFHAPSKLLLPLSYAAIFGGTITLIGTLTNLLINSFLMPYGYQTNLMVYSAGGYDMKTFFKSGIVISIVYSILVIGLIPLFFPF